MAKKEIILVIPDLHTPFHHKCAIKFLTAIKEKYNPRKIICLGDELDKHNLSFHDTDPDIPFSPSSELEKAIWYLQDFYELFPKVDIVESNHGSMVYRKGKSNGIPRHYFKSYREILEAPKGWVWHNDLILTLKNKEKVYFHHGLSKNAIKIAQEMGMHHICGHYHTEFGIKYFQTPSKLLWAVNSGCLIDDAEMAFNYNKTTARRPALGATLIIDGKPIIIPMVLNDKNKWDKKLL